MYCEAAALVIISMEDPHKNSKMHVCAGVCLFIWESKNFFPGPNRKLGDGLFLQSCAEVAELYPKIKYENIIIDNCCMQVLELTKLTPAPIF